MNATLSMSINCAAGASSGDCLKIDDLAPEVLIIRDLKEILRVLSGLLFDELAKDICVSSENNRGSWIRGSGQILSVVV